MRRLAVLSWWFATFAALVLPIVATHAAAQPMGDCTAETSLDGRSDVFYCEPFETEDWWVGRGYLDSQSSNNAPALESEFEHVFLETENCIDGNCIRVHIPQYECCGLSIVWPLAAVDEAPDELYYRYYLRLAENFSPALCDRSGERTGDGGKLPGLGDGRAWPDEQCGNGGDPGDGINCWTVRSSFRGCANACEESPAATTRFGSYVYYPHQEGPWGNQALWDDDVNRQSGPTCSPPTSSAFDNCPEADRVPCGRGPDVTATCGIDSYGNLQNDRWYSIEMQVRMNTPGVEDGVLRGWIDGNLAFEKTNMVWRLLGHDNLHVRTVWMNIHFGGEFVGPCMAGGTDVYMDQMVVSSSYIGPMGAARPPLDGGGPPLDGGVPRGAPDSGSGADGGGMDAGARRDAGTVGGDLPAGCGCRSVTANRTSLGGPLVLLMALSLIAGRKRR